MIKVKPKKFPSSLRTDFKGSARCQYSYSQAWQDIFVLVALDGLVEGKYVEIGAGDARNINNTYLLEKEFGWVGVSLDIDPKAVISYRRRRTNQCLLADACQVDFSEIFKEIDFGSQVDYLQVDIEPSTNSLKALRNFMASGVKPRVVTFETDFYDPNMSEEVSQKVRNESRDLMWSLGYELIAGDVGSTSAANPFEDWYVDPKQVDLDRLTSLMAGPSVPRASEVVIFSGPFVVNTELYDGQGLGNQLWAYAVTRLAAQYQGFEYGITGRENFKGKSFINLDFGLDLKGGISNQGGPPLTLPLGVSNYYSEEKTVEVDSGLDVSVQDLNLWKLPPNTKIDGNFQSFEYLRSHEELVRSWVQVMSTPNELAKTDTNACYVHVRGGDFKSLHYSSLGMIYYRNAIKYMRDRFGVTRFIAITDDARFAKEVLPSDVEIPDVQRTTRRDASQARHHIGDDVRGDFISLSQASYLIISNSSFSWWAAFLNSECKVVVAPKYWAAHNADPNLWSTAEIVTPGFTYVDSQGNFFSSDECQEEINSSLSISRKSLIGGLSALASVSQHLSGQWKHKWYLVVFGLVTIKQKLKSRM